VPIKRLSGVALLANPSPRSWSSRRAPPRTTSSRPSRLQLIRDVPLLRHLAPRARTSARAWSASTCGRAGPVAESEEERRHHRPAQRLAQRRDRPDDIEVPHNSDTQGKHDRLLELIKEFDAILKPGGCIVYLGTGRRRRRASSRAGPATTRAGLRAPGGTRAIVEEIAGELHTVREGDTTLQASGAKEGRQPPCPPAVAGNLTPACGAQDFPELGRATRAERRHPRPGGLTLPFAVARPLGWAAVLPWGRLVPPYAKPRRDSPIAMGG
jgi:hypothetical protein